jgi:prepilin-type N-terminal cleavage/methylation domain-containing protein
MRRGFTLIEVIITTAVFAVLMFAVTQLYVVYGRVMDLQKSSIQVALGSSSIMGAAREAGLQAGHVATAHVFSGVNYTSSTTTVIFELPSIDASGTVIPSTYDYVGIYASGASVYRSIDAAAGSARRSGTKVLTNTLDSLTISYDSDSFPAVASVTVNATTSVMVRGVATQVHLREHIYLRNL